MHCAKSAQYCITGPKSRISADPSEQVGKRPHGNAYFESMRLNILEAVRDPEIKDKVRIELMAPSVEMIPDLLETIGEFDFTVDQTQ